MAKKTLAKSKSRNQAPRASRRPTTQTPAEPADVELMQRFAKLLSFEEQDGFREEAIDVAMLRSDERMNKPKGFVQETWSPGDALAAALTGGLRPRCFHEDALRQLAAESRIMAAAIMDAGQCEQDRLCSKIDLLYFAKGMAGRAKAAEQMGRRYHVAQKLLAHAQTEGGK